MADACRHLRVAWQPIKDAWVCVDCLKVCLESVDLANEAIWILEELLRMHQAGKLQFFGEHAALADDAKAFKAWLAPLRQCAWVVYAKKPFAGPQAVLAYLSRYTHRVAISNRRLLGLENGKVTLRWKDYARGNAPSIMTLDVMEFIRRFLMHVMPRSFVRTRYYGFMANRHRAETLQRCRQLLGAQKTPETQNGNATAPIDAAPGENPVAGYCPQCRQGRMRIIGLLVRQHLPAAPPAQVRVVYQDTS